ncbi:hypothetical protein CANARDRAFT_28500 [[Candida] arabinofermentans NRRL YB-2248]|uniref:Uncharacterized protein n=1 Tax=[Candida] arabinofermentans NRRL YB-2248 TaxID=983967 RepID=A0A1E4T0E6_9ASCO|nr:hypothetical protein CANARDRAFT_28500 [[Candida] arabinofermentans NRRL YB-2248]
MSILSPVMSSFEISSTLNRDYSTVSNEDTRKSFNQSWCSVDKAVAIRAGTPNLVTNKAIDNPVTCRDNLYKDTEHFAFSSGFIALKEARQSLSLPYDITDGPANELISLLKRTLKKGKKSSQIKGKLKRKFSKRSLSSTRSEISENNVGLGLLTTEKNHRLIRSLYKELLKSRVAFPYEEYNELMKRYRSVLESRISNPKQLLEDSEPLTGLGNYFKSQQDSIFDSYPNAKFNFKLFVAVATAMWLSLGTYEQLKSDRMSTNPDQSFSDPAELQRFIDTSSIDSSSGGSDIEDTLIDFTVDFANMSIDHTHDMNCYVNGAHSSSQSPDQSSSSQSRDHSTFSNVSEEDDTVEVPHHEATVCYNEQSNDEQPNISQDNGEPFIPICFLHSSNDDEDANETDEEKENFSDTNIDEEEEDNNDCDDLYEEEEEDAAIFLPEEDVTCDTTLPSEYAGGSLNERLYEEHDSSHNKPIEVTFMDFSDDTDFDISTPATKAVTFPTKTLPPENDTQALNVSEKIDRYEVISGGNPKPESFWGRLSKMKRFYVNSMMEGSKDRQSGGRSPDEQDSTSNIPPPSTLKKAERKSSLILQKPLKRATDLLPPDHPYHESTFKKDRSIRERLGDLLDARLFDIATNESRNRIVTPQGFYERFTTPESKPWTNMMIQERMPYYLSFERVYHDIFENYMDYSFDLVAEVAEVCLEFGKDSLPLVIYVILHSDS